ncbi:proline-rich membrane anchor 1-like [Pseudorasbora parva]|uniref:proline-rich membrane anchor 1-like n=1 Tax=Pseudorasbora parva TaxID=51549 RepID=UPI00351EF2F3
MLDTLVHALGLLSCLLFSQVELQSLCSQRDIRRGGECHHLPPPPPPPPPPPALLSVGFYSHKNKSTIIKAPEASAPLLSSWWMEIIVVGTTGSALAVFLLLTVFIFYKAIKRKPLKKEKNGTGCGGDAISSFKKINNAAV